MLWQKHTYDLAVVIGGIPHAQQCLGFRHRVTPNGLETQICVESRIRIECFELWTPDAGYSITIDRIKVCCFRSQG